MMSFSTSVIMVTLIQNIANRMSPQIIFEHNGLFSKWSGTFIEFREFRESEESLKHELGSV